MKYLFCCLFLSFNFIGVSQILETNPPFPTADDTITVIYTATLGNGALSGFTGDIYAHTGLITSKSSSATDWKYTQGTWGTADAKVKMTSLGNNRYKIKYHIRSFYGLSLGETILKLAFVFRNVTGTLVGRETDGSDIFYNFPSSGFSAQIISHTTSYSFAKLKDSIFITGAASSKANLELLINGVSVEKDTGTSITHTFIVNTTCINIAVLKAEGSTTLYDTLYIVTPDLAQIDVWPNGAEDGITYLSDVKLRFSIYAPGKEFVYIIGDFNGWLPSCTYQLSKTPDGKRFWIDISGFTPGKEYGFQYLVDGVLKIADPYSQTILDPNNDGSISSITYPNLKKYPAGKTTGLVTLITPGKSAFVWKTSSYKKPKKTDLVVYELLVRDFVAARNFKTLKDTLGYLKRLGINCIELMPVMEFEGNNSWGYNVSYHAALDKAYGNIDDFKKLIDECHRLDMAVVLDIALNHAFSQNSLCQLYWDAVNFRPASNNPWLNPIEKHPYNVGYDFDHESIATQYYVDKVLKYWLTEFKIDGFRFDLSKGFTQKNTGSDVNAWGQYDQSRINLLKRMGDKLNAIDSSAFLILEHFADNSEESVLSNYGFMLWGNLVNSYNQSSMGFGSDLSWGNYKQRSWATPNLVTYLESHDEERLMYKNSNFGNASGSYNIKDLKTGLKRNELAGVFFFTIPGPKMFWQFGELGYDVSINQNGRTGEKPIYWQYENNNNRKNLYNIWSDLIKLKTEKEIFETTDFSTNLSGNVKTIYLNNPNAKVAVLGNFNLTNANVTANFQQTGRWYEFFTNDSITISTLQQNFNFAPGEYRLYSTEKYNKTTQYLGKVELKASNITVYPNPAHDKLFIDLGAEFKNEVQIELVDVTGRILLKSVFEHRLSQLDLPDLTNGIYFIKISSENGNAVKKILIGE